MSARVIPLRPKAPEPFLIGTLNIYDFVEITGFRRWNTWQAYHRGRA